MIVACLHKHYNYITTIYKRKRLIMMDKKKFYRSLFTLVVPLAVQNFMSAVVSASDALMLGWLDQQSLSAVSLATQVQFVLNLFLMAITIGLTILAAQYWGKGDMDSVETVLGIALRFAITISSIFAAAAIGIPELLMRVFTDESELIPLGAQYLRLVGISYIFTGISQVYLCVMKNSGRTSLSTAYGTAAMVLNLFLNSILIFGMLGFPELGIGGAAIATVIARSVELLFVLMENCKTNIIKMRWQYLLRTSKQLTQDFIQYTTPVMANELAWGCGFAMFSVIMGHLGSDAIAANFIANIVKNIIACVAYGVGTGSGIMVGNELGRGDLARARQYGDKLVRVSIIIGAISGGIIFVGIPVITAFSGNLSAQANAYLKAMLCVCSYYIIGKSVNSTVIAGIFCAGGDTKFGMICDAITMWLIVVPIGAFSAFVLKLPVMAVYVLLNIDEIIKLPAVYHHYKKYRWLKDLTRQADAFNLNHYKEGELP